MLVSIRLRERVVDAAFGVQCNFPHPVWMAAAAKLRVATHVILDLEGSLGFALLARRG